MADDDDVDVSLFLTVEHKMSAMPIDVFDCVIRWIEVERRRRMDFPYPMVTVV